MDWLSAGRRIGGCSFGAERAIVYVIHDSKFLVRRIFFFWLQRINDPQTAYHTMTIVNRLLARVTTLLRSYVFLRLGEFNDAFLMFTRALCPFGGLERSWKKETLRLKNLGHFEVILCFAL